MAEMPIPYQFIANPELYKLAVREYINSLMRRVQDSGDVTALNLTRVIASDEKEVRDL